MNTTRFFAVLFAAADGCGGHDRPSSTAAGGSVASAKAATSTQASNSAAGPIDVCSIVTLADAAAILGTLPGQPPSKTENAGLASRICMCLGPRVAGAG